MATYVNNLRLKEITTGDESGSWGNSTNTNLELIGEALGIGTEAITTNADTHSTIVADGSADAGRAMYLKYTGALDSDCTITITPNTMKRVQIIENATTDSGSSGPYNIIISQGSGANVTIANGKVAIVQLDGAGSGAAVLDALTDLQVTDTLSVNGTTITLGDGTAEDTKLVYDGNAKDFYIGLDDSADKLVIGDGSTVGTNSILTLTDDTVTIGDGAAVDTAIVFDGNAQDFYIALDDSADDLLIGLGSTVGTTPIISVDENKDVAIPDGGLTITTSDNTDQLSLVSTDADANSGPNLRMYRNSGSPADGDVLGAIEFEGRNDNSEDIKYAELFAETYDVSDGTEDGRFFIKTMVGGSSTHRMYMNFNETNFNEGSADLDFRVESNGNANRFFIDGGSNSGEGAVIVGHNASLGLHRVFQITGNSPDTSGMEMFKYTNDTSGPTISMTKSRGGSIGSSTSVNDGDTVGQITWFADDGTDTANIVATIHAEIDGTPGSDDTPGALVFGTTADGANSQTERMRIDDSGKVGINQNSPSANLHITGSGDTKIIIEDGTDEQFITAHSGGLNYGVVSGDAHTFVVDGTDKVQFKDGFYGFGATAAIDSEVMNLTRNGTTKFIINCTENSSARDAIFTLHTRSTAAQCRISFNDGAGAGSGAGQIYYNHDGNDLIFITDGTEVGKFAGNGDFYTNDGTVHSLSDQRLKTNVEDYTYDMDVFKSYQTKMFDWINPEEHGNRSRQIGFIAQEQEAIDARFVKELDISPDSADTALLDTITKEDGDVRGIGKTSEFNQKDGMYISIIQQLIKRLETAEEKITALEGGK